MNLGTIFATLKIFDEMSPALKTAGYQLTNFGQGLTHVGVLASGMSLALAAAAKQVVTLGSEFEHSTIKLVALAGVTKDELEGVRQHLLDLAPAVGLGPGALSEAMYTVSSTMGDTAEAVKVLDTATLGAMIGMGKAKDVAGALTSVVLAYGKETISAARAGDILTRVIRDGGAEAHELAPRLAKVVPFAAQLGVSFEEVGANIATMTKLGVPASQAVTSLASVFAALARAVPRGQRALAEVGMTYAGLRAEIKEKGLAEALIRLRETFKDNEEGLIDVVGRLEALKDVLGTTGPMAETYRQVLGNIKDSQGELKESADLTRESLQFQWESLQASIEVVWIEIANSLLPILKEAVRLFHATLPPLLSMIDAFSGLPDWIKLGTLALVGFFAVLGPGLILVGQMGMGLGYLMRGFQLFTGGSVAVTSMIWPLKLVAAQMSIFGVQTGLSTSKNLLLAASAGTVTNHLGQQLPLLTRVVSGTLGWGMQIGSVIAKMNPMIGVITGVIGAMIWSSREEKINSDAVMVSSGAILEKKEKLEKLSEKLTGNILLNNELHDIYGELIRINPAFLGVLSSQTHKQQELRDATREVTKAFKERLQNEKVLLELSMSQNTANIVALEKKAAEIQARINKDVKFNNEYGDAGLGKIPEKIINADRGELSAIEKQLDDLRETTKGVHAQLVKVSEGLNDTYKATNNAASAFALYETKIKELKGGIAEFQRGLKLAKISEDDLSVAMNDSAKMAALLKDVELALSRAREANTNTVHVLTKAEIAAAEAREKAIAKGWASIIKAAEEARDRSAAIKEKAVSDTATAMQQISVLTQDTNARILDGDNLTYEAKIVNVHKWVKETIFGLNKLQIAGGQYFLNMIAIVTNGAARIVQIEKERVRAQKEATAKVFEEFAEMQNKTLILTEETEVIRQRLLGDAYQTDLANNRKTYEKKRADIEENYLKILRTIQKYEALGVFWKELYAKTAKKLTEDQLKQLDELKKKMDELTEKLRRIAQMKDVAELVKETSIAISDLLGNDFSEFSKWISELSSHWDKATKAVIAYAEATSDAQRATAVIQAAAALASATNQPNAGRGAVAGAVTGFRIFGPIGAAVGGVIGALRGSNNADQARVKAFWEQQRAIAALKKELTDLYGGHERLGQLYIALGITQDSFGDSLEQVTARANLFKEKIAAITTEMTAIKDELRVASAELIAFRDAMPTDPLVVEFVLQQVQVAGDSVARMLTSLQASATAAAKRAALADDPNANVSDIIGKVKLTAAGAMAMSSILIASFDGTVESLRKMQPTLLLLQNAMKNSGVEGSAAFNQILGLANLATDEITGPMIDAINEGTNALVAMHNSGFLTQEVFAGLLGEIQAQRAALLANGATNEQVNQIMAPSLQKIWELWKTGKYEVDEVTLAQLKAAEAAGTVGNAHRSATDRMVIALERLAEMFETVFGDNLADAAARGRQAAQDELNKLHLPPLEWVPKGGTGQNNGGGNGNIENPLSSRPFLDFNGGSIPMVSNSGGRTVQSQDQTIVVTLDGDVIVRKVVRGTPAYLELMGVQ